MQVIGSRSAAHRAVVVYGILRIHAAEQQHVREMVPDGLGNVLVAGYHQMVPENRERVNLDVVAAAFLAFVFEVELLLGPVFRAEEAFPGGYGFGVDFGGGGSDSAGVHLHDNPLAAHSEFLFLRILDEAEVPRRERPDRKLIAYEFIDIAHRSESSCCEILPNSSRKAGVKSSLGALAISP